VIIDRGTLAAWVMRVAWWLELLYDALLTFIRSQPRMFCDETPLPRLDPGRKRTKLCQLSAEAVDDRLWNGPAPPAVAYIFAESRSAREVEGQLSSFAGVLQVDGYQAYKTMAKRRGKSNVAPMRLTFCVAYARRKFVDVVELTGSTEAVDPRQDRRGLLDRSKTARRKCRCPPDGTASRGSAEHEGTEDPSHRTKRRGVGKIGAWQGRELHA